MADGPAGDLGRIQRQQDFVRRVLKKANEKARGLNALAISRLVDSGIKNVQIDKGLKPGTSPRWPTASARSTRTRCRC